MGVVSGKVYDSSGNPVAGRTVRAYRRSDGTLAGETVTGSGGSIVDPHFGAVTFLLNGNGTAGSAPTQDESEKRKVLAQEGAPAYSTTQSKFGGTSLRFTALGDRLKATHPDFMMWCADFTVEAWVYPTSYTADFTCVVATRAHGNGQNAWQLGFHSNGYAYIFDGTTVHQTANGKVPLNAWTHIAGSHVNGVYRVFVNGILEFTSTAISPPRLLSIQELTIGGSFNGYQQFYGYLNALRITRGVARYTATFTPSAVALPTAAPNNGDPFFSKVSLLCNFEGSNGATTFTDLSNDARAMVRYGSVSITTAEKKFGNSSLHANNNGLVLVDPESDQGLRGDTEFTAEMWVKNAGTNAYYLLSMGGGEGIAFNGWSIFFGGDLNPAVYFIGSSNNIQETHGGANLSGVANTLRLNEWNHVAFTKHGNTITLWVNGARSFSTNVRFLDRGGEFYNTGTRGLQIGGSFKATWGGSTFDLLARAYIDSVRVTKACRYYENFVPPGRAFPTSLPTTAAGVGEYMLDMDAGECFVVAFDDDAGTLENDLILRTFPV